METVQEQIRRHKIVPVIKLNSPDDALPLMEALVAGGLPVAEITFRTDAAQESIRRVAAKFPQVLVGAGTITNVEQLKRAVDAGAKFAVTPGFSRPVAEYCVSKGIPLYPGACTPTEVMYLLELGLTVAKFFPAAQYGGLATIKALAAPFPQMSFMPTGGVSAANILEYLDFAPIIACGGSWMVQDKLIAGGKFDEIRRLTAEAVDLVGNHFHGG